MIFLRKCFLEFVSCKHFSLYLNFFFFKLSNVIIYFILEENGICGENNSSASDSNWIQIYPPTLTTKLVYCLKYLVPTGEYQEVCYLFNVMYDKILYKKIISSF